MAQCILTFTMEPSSYKTRSFVKAKDLNIKIYDIKSLCDRMSLLCRQILRRETATALKKCYYCHLNFTLTHPLVEH